MTINCHHDDGCGVRFKSVHADTDELALYIRRASVRVHYRPSSGVLAGMQRLTVSQKNRIFFYIAAIYFIV